MKEFDEHSLHGGETDVDDGTPAAAVVEMTKEQVKKQYGIKAKLTVRSAMTKTHTVKLQPRRRAHDGEVAGREEENDERRVHGKIKRLELAGWVRKELAELGHASLQRRRRWFDGEGSTELWPWRRENRVRERG